MSAPTTPAMGHVLGCGVVPELCAFPKRGTHAVADLDRTHPGLRQVVDAGGLDRELPLDPVPGSRLYEADVPAGEHPEPFIPRAGECGGARVPEPRQVARELRSNPVEVERCVVREDRVGRLPGSRDRGPDRGSGMSRREQPRRSRPRAASACSSGLLRRTGDGVPAGPWPTLRWSWTRLRVAAASPQGIGRRAPTGRPWTVRHGSA